MSRRAALLTPSFAGCGWRLGQKDHAGGRHVIPLPRLFSGGSHHNDISAASPMPTTEKHLGHLHLPIGESCVREEARRRRRRDLSPEGSLLGDELYWHGVRSAIYHFYTRP
jgi:hypothetical protein